MAWRYAWLGMDRNHQVLAFSATPLGIIVLHLGFLTALAATMQFSIGSIGLISITLIGCALWPSRRLLVMSLSGAIYIALRPFRTSQQRDFVEKMRDLTPEAAELPHLAFQTPIVLLFLMICGIALRLQKRFRTSLMARRPVLAQFIALAALITLASIISPGSLFHTVLWTLIVIYTASFFFLSYALADQRSAVEVPAAVRLGFLRPFWSGPSIPFKGITFLTKFEARSPQELAATQLRALKLVVWAVLLASLHALLDWAFHDVAALPDLTTALAMTVEGTPPSQALGWIVVIKAFVMTLLWVATTSHALVAIVRMAGYGIPRGMARPLSSRSIAEFWNRYLFYFKEILVDFFFYPAFARYFKQRPRLRIAFATFCAAFVGNLLFSLLTQAHLVAEIGLIAALGRFESYAFYALVLTAALIGSQLMTSKPSPADGFWRYHVVPRVTIIGFFTIMQIFADETGQFGLADRADFLLHLFWL